MVRDGLQHERCSMMDTHNGDSLLSGCLTSVDCMLSVLHLGVGDLLVFWWTPFIEAKWRSHLFKEFLVGDVEHFSSWRRDSSPSLHVGAWFLIQRIGDGLRTPGDLIVFL